MNLVESVLMYVICTQHLVCIMCPYRTMQPGTLCHKNESNFQSCPRSSKIQYISTSAKETEGGYVFTHVRVCFCLTVKVNANIEVNSLKSL